MEILATVVAAHTIAGGALPSWPWIALMGGSILGGSLVVLRRRVPLLLAVPALVAVQLLLHSWLMVLAPSTPGAMTMHHGMSGMPASGGGLGLDGPMIFAHVVGALVTALVWQTRSRLADVVLTWHAALLHCTPTRPGSLLIGLPARPLAGWGALFVAPQRGPPPVVRAPA